MAGEVPLVGQFASFLFQDIDSVLSKIDSYEL